MDIKDVQKSWDTFGKTDPLWAVLTYSDKMGNRWELDEFFETGVREIEGVMQVVAALKLPLERGRALDFGCAVGRLTQALAAHFDAVVGVDIAPSMLELARQYNRHGERCRYLLNSSDDLQQFPDNAFDFVYSLITLQHVAPRYSQNYLKEFLRVLRPGGLLLFQLPSEMTTGYRVRRLFRRFIPTGLLGRYRKSRYGEQHVAPPEHHTAMEMYGIKREAVVRLLEENGGRVVDVQPDDSAWNWISFRYCVQKR
jgi:ubiquinone/menaquinone biosynthesis C-methylase UbiE